MIWFFMAVQCCCESVLIGWVVMGYSCEVDSRLDGEFAVDLS